MELESNHGHLASGTHSSLPLDPVCGMQVDPARAAGSTTYDGKTYFFCCLSCLRKFQAEPQKYVRGEPDTHPTPTHSAPEPATEVAGMRESVRASPVTYTCQTHPHVMQYPTVWLLPWRRVCFQTTFAWPMARFPRISTRLPS